VFSTSVSFPQEELKHILGELWEPDDDDDDDDDDDEWDSSCG